MVVVASGLGAWLLVPADVILLTASAVPRIGTFAEEEEVKGALALAEEGDVVSFGSGEVMGAGKAVEASA